MPGAGIYRVDANRHVIVRERPPNGLSILDTLTGHARHLTPSSGDVFTHGPTRSRPTPVTGRVALESPGRLIWTSDALGTLAADRVDSRRTSVVVQTRDGGRLDGALLLPNAPEHDQSNPPDSARRFRRALERAGNPRVDVRTFPGVNHGAWVVDSLAFDPDAIERRDPAVFEFIVRWVAEQVGL